MTREFVGKLEIQAGWKGEILKSRPFLLMLLTPTAQISYLSNFLSHNHTVLIDK